MLVGQRGYRILSFFVVSLLILSTVAYAADAGGAFSNDTETGASQPSTANTGYEPFYYYIEGMINPANGNLFITKEDIVLKTVGYEELKHKIVEYRFPEEHVKNLVLERSYNSLVREDGPFGFGWTHTYNVYLEAAGIDVILHEADGSEHRFVSAGGGNFDAPAGIKLRLRKIGSGFELKDNDGTTWSFSNAGRLTSIVDRNGNIVSFVYSGGRLTQVNGFHGLSLSFSYNAQGRIESATDMAGRQIAYTYDGSGNLIEVRDAMGFSTRYFYDNDHRLTATVDRVNVATLFEYSSDAVTKMSLALYNQTNFTWALPLYSIEYRAETAFIKGPRFTDTTIQFNAAGNPTTIIDALGGATKFYWDADMNLVLFRDANRNEYSYSYDSYGNNIEAVNALGYRTTYNWTTVDTDTTYLSYISSFRNKRGVEAFFNYDNAGNLVQADVPGYSIQYAYDNEGNLANITNARGYTTAYSYDFSNRTFVVTDGLGNTTQYEYDLSGRLTRLINAKGYATIFEYDANDRLISQQDALVGQKFFSYNEEGSLINETDELGRIKSQANNMVSQASGVTDTSGNATLYEHDPDRNLASIQDKNGNKKSYEYDALGRMTEVTDALGNTETYTYDAVGNVLSYTDKNGHITAYTYDAFNRKILEIDAEGNEQRWAYDEGDNVVNYTDKNGNVFFYEYDALGRQVKEIDPLGGMELSQYDGNGHEILFTDENNHTRQRVFDPLDRIAEERDALGQSMQYGYDAVGNLIKITDRKGNAIILEYDALNRMTRVIDPLGFSNQFRYDAVGNMVNRTDERGFVTTFLYDGLNRLVKITDPLGFEELMEYDAEGNVIRKLDKNGNAMRFEYDELNRLVREIDALNHQTSYEYDAMGNVLRTTDPNSRVTSFEYDGLNRKVKETDALGFSTRYTYDGTGNLLTFNDANNHTTSFSYDQLGRRLTYTTALDNIITYAYDPAGNMLRRTDADDKVTVYTYDPLDRLTQKTYQGIGTITYGYDPNGNLLSVNQTGIGLNDSLEFSYDVMNRRTTARIDYGLFAKNISFAYDGTGNRVSAVYPDGTWIDYSYDALNRPVAVNDTISGVATIAYDAGGRRTSLVLGNSITTAYVHDAADRIVSVVNKKSDNSLISNFTYTYDNFTNRLSATTTTPQGTNTTWYDYDEAYRLTRAAENSAIFEYTYDPVGNRLEKNESGVYAAYEYDSDNRMLTEGAISYSYDNSGNRIAKIEGPDTTTYEYDFENRLVRTALPGGSAIEFAYSETGKRLLRQNGTDSIFMFYDGDFRIADYSGSGTLINRYVYSRNIDEVLSMAGPAGVFYYQYDALSVKTVAHANQTIANTYRYAPFGDFLQKLETVANPFTFTGREYEPEIELYYYRTRMYDPSSGRFNSKDRLPVLMPFAEAEEANLYAYVWNNPVNFIDPMGFQGTYTVYKFAGKRYSTKEYDEESLKKAWEQLDKDWQSIKEIVDELNSKWPKMKKYKKNLEDAANREWWSFAFDLIGVGLAIAGIFTANPFLISAGIHVALLDNMADQDGAADVAVDGFQGATEIAGEIGVARDIFKNALGIIGGIADAIEAVGDYAEAREHEKALEKAREANEMHKKGMNDGTFQKMIDSMYEIAQQKAAEAADKDKKKPPPPVPTGGGGGGPTPPSTPPSEGGGSPGGVITPSTPPGVDVPPENDPIPGSIIPIDVVITNPGFQEITVNISTFTYNPELPQSILLVVDESDGAHIWFEEALNETVGEHGYEEVFVDTQYTPLYEDDNESTKDLNDYDTVIWESSNDREGTLQPPAQQELKKYLNASGCLFVGGEGVMHEWPQRSDTLMADYMFADGHETDTFDLTVTGVPGTIGDGLELNLFGGTGSNFENYSSNIGGVKLPGQADFLYEQLIAGIEGIGPWNESITNSTYKTVLFAYDFDSIELKDDRIIVMSRILDFLNCQNGTGGPVPPGDGDGGGGDGEPPGIPVPPGTPVPTTTTISTTTPGTFTTATTVATPTTTASGTTTTKVKPTTSVTTVIESTFDDPNNPGACTDEGWDSDSESVQPPYTDLSDYNAFGNTGFSWWIGSFEGEPFWATPPGYGNYWDQFLTFPTIDISGAANPAIVFSYKVDTEPNDVVFFEVLNPNTGQWDVIDSFWGNSGWVEAYRPVFDIQTYGPALNMRFHFVADNLNSDEDGGYDGEGAFYADEILVFDEQQPIPRDFLIWEPDETPISGQALLNSLANLGYSGDYTTTLQGYDLSQYRSVFVLLGMYPFNYVIHGGSPEALMLENYIVTSRGNVYMEGGDVWYWDPLNENGHNFNQFFGINPIDDGGYYPLYFVDGTYGTFTEGMHFLYQGESGYPDEIEAIPPFAENIFTYEHPYYYIHIGVSNDVQGGQTTVGTSFEFGGLVDSYPPSTKDYLVYQIMSFFEVMPKSKSPLEFPQTEKTTTLPPVSLPSTEQPAPIAEKKPTGNEKKVIKEVTKSQILRARQNVLYYNNGGDSPGTGDPPTPDGGDTGDYFALYPPGTLPPYQGESCEWAPVDPVTLKLPNFLIDYLQSPPINLSKERTEGICRDDRDIFMYYDAYINLSKSGNDSLTIEIKPNASEPWRPIRSNFKGVYGRRTFFENLGQLDSTDVQLRFTVNTGAGPHPGGIYINDVTFSCLKPNTPPVLDTIGNRAVNERETLTIDVNATDLEGEPLTYFTNAGEVLPSLFAFNPRTGMFQWTPAYFDAGMYNVTFNVTDGIDWDSEIIQITVIDVPIDAELNNPYVSTLSNFTINGTIYVEFDAFNNNDVTLYNVSLKLDTDSSDPDIEFRIPIFRPYQEINFILHWNYSQPGTYQPFAFIDYAGQLPEYDESNNIVYFGVMNTIPPQCQPPASGNWTINQPCAIGGGTFVLNGNLLVQPTGSLFLQGVTILMNSSYDGHRSIIVNRGSLNADNARFAPVNPQNAYTFDVKDDSQFTLTNSNVSGAGYNSTALNKLGLYIAADNAVIENTSVNCRESVCVGIILNNSAFSRIENNFINISSRTWRSNGLYIIGNSSDNMVLDNIIYSYGNESNGIYLRASGPRNLVYGNTILQYGNYDAWGLLIDYSRNTIAANNYIETFDERGIGIFVRNSSNSIIDNTAVITHGLNADGLYLDESENVEFIDSLISAQGYDVFVTHTGDYLLLNTTFDKNDVFFETQAPLTGKQMELFKEVSKRQNLLPPTATLTVKWYVDAFVGYENAFPVEGALVKGYSMPQNIIEFSALTGHDGRIQTQNATEYRQIISGKTYYTPHEVNATKDGLSDSGIVNITESVSLNFVLIP